MRQAGSISTSRYTDGARLVSRGDKGDFAGALGYARELLTLDLVNAQLQALVAELEKKVKP